jgi:flavin-dependent dehydrogenase
VSDPVIVVGGGLAGSAAAAYLARAGVKVSVIEREAAPGHKICGEFLSVEAQDSLARIGFDVNALGGHRITKLRLVRGARAVTADLPFQALGVTRRALDQALLDHAAACGAEIHTGQMVRGIETGRSINVDLAGVGMLPAQAVFLATGKHDLRGLRRDAPPPEALVGFKMYFRLDPPARAALSGHIELILFRDGYAGLQLVETGQANLCLLIDKARLRRIGGRWEDLLADLRGESPHLAARLARAAPCLPRPLTISRVPYGFMHAPRAADPAGVYRLGDQAGVIPSFAGDGMAIALHSAALAARSFLAGQSATRYHRDIQADISGQIGRASALYRISRSGAGQRALFGLASLWPRALQLAAQATRLREPARI